MRARPPVGEPEVDRGGAGLCRQAPPPLRQRARRHPTSTAGRIWGRKCGTARPAQPIMAAARAVDERLDRRSRRSRSAPARARGTDSVSSVVMPARSGYHQKVSSAWIGASSSRSAGTKGRSTRRSVVSVGMPGCAMRRSGRSARSVHGGRRQPAAARGHRRAKGRGRAAAVGAYSCPGRKERTDRSPGPPADHLHPLVARLAVDDVRDELPGGAAQAGPVDLHRRRPGAGRPTWCCGAGQPRPAVDRGRWVDGCAQARPGHASIGLFSTGWRGMVRRVSTPVRILTSWRSLHRGPSRHRRSRRSPTARWPSASPRSSGCPSPPRPTRSRAPWSTPRSKGLFWHHAPGARTPAAAAAELDRAWRDLQDDEEFAQLELDATMPSGSWPTPGAWSTTTSGSRTPTRPAPSAWSSGSRPTVDGMRLRGIIDRLDIDDDGSLIVVDYKTGPRPVRALRARQPRSACRPTRSCARACSGARPPRSACSTCASPLPSPRSLREQTIRGQRKRAVAVWRAIERACDAEDFRPHVGPLCDHCHFKTSCPAFAA